MYREPSVRSAGLAGSQTRHAQLKPQRECEKEMKNDTTFERQHGVVRGREFTSLLLHTLGVI